jgi:putative ABC transport system permease protein
VWRVISALDRKLLRDLYDMAGRALAICMVLASGIAAFVMALSTHASLELTRSTYYERCRFADVFTHLKRAPNSLTDRIAEIPGVAKVQTRIVVDVTLDIPHMTDPAVGRLLSIPDRGRPPLNDLYLREGRFPEPGRKGEALVSEAFAEKHNLKPGDKVAAIINGKKQYLRITGIALSPEYIFVIKPGEILPDDKRFGLFWMCYTELAAGYDMQGAFNDVALTLMPGAQESEVILRLDRLTAPYGSLGAFGRDEQTSHKLISNELRQLQGQAIVSPSIFLLVTTFLLNVVISRLVKSQREQIAALKAFGYTRFEIGLHYFKFMFLLVLLGVTLGVAAGAILGQWITEMYNKFFRFPVFDYHLGLDVVLLALAISTAAGVIATVGAVRMAVLLPPAEAMRPEPPADYRPTFVERVGLQRLFSQPTRMILRRLERQPVQAAITVIGIALALGVLILGNFVEDMVNFVIENQFFTSQRQDISVTFIEPTTARVEYEVGHLPGVSYVETYRSVGIRLRFGHRSRRMAIMGLQPQPRLFRLLDTEQKDIPLPPEGLLISKKLAEIMEANVGDIVTVEVMEGERPIRQVAIVAFVDDYSEPAAYMDKQALHRFLHEAECHSGAFLRVDRKYHDDFFRTVKQMPRVAGVTIKEAALRSFEKTLAENLLIIKTFNVVFACIIAFGVVYNSARITLAERSRELATLRVIGFTRGEISYILLGELAILTLTAIPLGLVFGTIFGKVVSQAMETEFQRFPFIISSHTYAFAVTVILAATVISGLLVRRGLDHLNLVAVLKSRE